ncbi:hypothetical protein QNH39_27615 [Neobacillus novalis]|uniref:SGNH hydrolase-type esterase domain-containing protein n=1 Tax=Neobacillus novalis TaxID=220687 RepID=A0AA95MQ27_9BACI|nr:GDSL-type esterase/lipase family protein [Neobacillus novalis]WHY86289.1 hypothetical protein QNH39_27615 [Neobacillus novalis]
MEQNKPSGANYLSYPLPVFLSRLPVLEYYNPFPDIPIAEQAINEFNSLISSFGREMNVKVADIYSVFKGKEKDLLSRGGIHPNSEGYYQMALALSRLGYSPLDEKPLLK